MPVTVVPERLAEFRTKVTEAAWSLPVEKAQNAPPVPPHPVLRKSSENPPLTLVMVVLPLTPVPENPMVAPPSRRLSDAVAVKVTHNCVLESETPQLEPLVLRVTVPTFVDPTKKEVIVSAEAAGTSAKQATPTRERTESLLVTRTIIPLWTHNIATTLQGSNWHGSFHLQWKT